MLDKLKPCFRQIHMKQYQHHCVPQCYTYKAFILWMTCKDRIVWLWPYHEGSRDPTSSWNQPGSSVLWCTLYTFPVHMIHCFYVALPLLNYPCIEGLAGKGWEGVEHKSTMKRAWQKSVSWFFSLFYLSPLLRLGEVTLKIIVITGMVCIIM